MALLQAYLSFSSLSASEASALSLIYRCGKKEPFLINDPRGNLRCYSVQGPCPSWPWWNPSPILHASRWGVQLRCRQLSPLLLLLQSRQEVSYLVDSTSKFPVLFLEAWFSVVWSLYSKTPSAFWRCCAWRHPTKTASLSFVFADNRRFFWDCW